MKLTEETRDFIINALKNGDSFQEFLDTPTEDLIGWHSSLGRWIRNQCGLWENYKEDEDDENESKHPDTISFKWIEEIHAYLHSQKDQHGNKDS